MARIQNIFPEDLRGSTAHPEDCSCRICTRLIYLLDELKKHSPFRIPKEKDGLPCCKTLVLNKANDTQANGPENILRLDGEHEELLCDCIHCSVIEAFGTQLHEADSSQVHNPDEVTSECSEPLFSDLQSSIIYCKDRPLAITTKNGELFAASDVSSRVDVPIGITNSKEKDENTKLLQLREVNLDEILDVCVCGEDSVSKVCVKHLPSFTRHSANKIIEDGCSCLEDKKCSYCQRLECLECQHDNCDLYDCPDSILSKTNDMHLAVNSWLDAKLEDAGIKLEAEKGANLSQDCKISLAGSSTADIGSELAQSLEEHVLEEWSWNPTAESPMVITNQMKSEVINVNELFDIRPWPRCYRLKGRIDVDGSHHFDEVYCELELESWKQPTKMVEDTFPLGSEGIPPPEDIVGKETEIKNPLFERMRKSVPKSSNLKVVGLNSLWQPIIKYKADKKNKSRWTKEEKEAKCKELLERLDTECPEAKPATQFPHFERVQEILDRFCEEPYPALEMPTLVDQQELEQWAAAVTNHLPQENRLGIIPEFWDGMEDWKPDPGENELRRRLVEEVRAFKKKIDPLRKVAFEGQSKVNVASWSALVDSVIDEAPDDLKDELKSIKNEVREKWLGDAGLSSLEGMLLSGDCNSRPTDIEEVPEEEESVVFPTLGEDIVVEDEPPPKFEGIQRYDDEEDVIEEGESLPTNVKERWEKEVSELTTALQEEEAKSGLIDIDKEMKAAQGKLLSKPIKFCPYIEDMLQKMVSYTSSELHPIQQLWKDKPFFPFWTPSVLYDLSDIEKSIFGDTDEPPIESDYDDEFINHLEGAVLSPEESKEVPGEIGDTVEKISKEEEVEDLLNLLQLEDDKWEKCLKNTGETGEVQTNNASGGSLTLEQLEKGIAGPVRSVAQFALELDSSCSFDMSSIIPDPAHSWSFALDTFQKQAIVALEAGLNVFVLAHTSAGKTAAAEYTIGMAERNGSKVIYTSPIKALSNQKYKDFKETFKNRINVGIITGDVQLNEEAQCLIMTTEILRSMLYNNSNRLNELEFVIFDEVHYFNDPERGNVWEEVLILLPTKCQILMLSATVANPMDFASWVGRRKERTVVVTKTSHRPTPLKHYLHVGTTAETTVHSFPLEVGNGFSYSSFAQAMEVKKSLEMNMPGKISESMRGMFWKNFIKYHLIERNCLPAVVFSFSRKKCDTYASYLSNIDLTTSASDAAAITEFIKKNVKKLSPSDQRIPQIVKMTSLLKRGIGVHHSGILPLLKEIVEVLFQSGKVRLLFATETFAMGVNMPARTVVFSSVRKFDGEESRDLKPAEYTQMAGRAGRRGKDRSGKVIILAWERRFVTDSSLAQMMTSESEKLQSRFRLRYSMILNTLTPRGDLSIDRIMNSTFLEHSLKPIIEKKKKHIEDIREAIRNVEECVGPMLAPEVKIMLTDYFDLCKETVLLSLSCREEMIKETKLQQHIRAGRLVTVFHMKYGVIQGVIVEVNFSSLVCTLAFISEHSAAIPSVMSRHELATELHEKIWKFAVGYRLELLNLCQPPSKVGLEWIKVQPSEIITIVAGIELPISPDLVLAMHGMPSNQPVKLGDQDIFDMLIQDLYNRLYAVSTGKLMYVDETAVMQIKFVDERASKRKKNFMQLRKLYAQLASTPIWVTFNIETVVDFYWTWIGEQEIKFQEEELKSKSWTIALLPDYQNKLELLKRRNFLEKDEMLTLEGNIASRIPTHEVFITEVLLKNTMDKLNAYETAALLSCLVYQDNNRMTADSSENDKGGVSLRNKMLSDSAQKKLAKVEQKLMKTNATITYTGGELDESIGMPDDEKVTETAMQRLERTLPQHLKEAIQDLEKLKDELDNEERLLGITDSEVSKISFRLVPVIYEWAKGQPFQNVMNIVKDMTQEGILVRWIQQLIEALKDIESASRLMGDPNTTAKLVNAAASLKRGIVYHQSLYLD